MIFLQKQEIIELLVKSFVQKDNLGKAIDQLRSREDIKGSTRN